MRQVQNPLTGAFELMEVDDVPCVVIILCSIRTSDLMLHGHRLQAIVGLVCVSELIPADSRQPEMQETLPSQSVPTALASPAFIHNPSQPPSFQPGPFTMDHPAWPTMLNGRQTYDSQPEIIPGSEVYGAPSGFADHMQNAMFYWPAPSVTESIAQATVPPMPMANTHTTSAKPPSAPQWENPEENVEVTDALFGTSVAQAQAIPYDGKIVLMFVFGVSI